MAVMRLSMHLYDALASIIAFCARVSRDAEGGAHEYYDQLGPVAAYP